MLSNQKDRLCQSCAYCSQPLPAAPMCSATRQRDITFSRLLCFLVSAQILSMKDSGRWRESTPFLPPVSGSIFCSSGSSAAAMAALVVAAALAVVTMTTVDMDSDCRDGSNHLQSTGSWVPAQTTGLHRPTEP